MSVEWFQSEYNTTCMKIQKELSGLYFLFLSISLSYEFWISLQEIKHTNRNAVLPE